MEEESLRGWGDQSVLVTSSYLVLWSFQKALANAPEISRNLKTQKTRLDAAWSNRSVVLSLGIGHENKGERVAKVLVIPTRGGSDYEHWK